MILLSSREIVEAFLQWNFIVSLSIYLIIWTFVFIYIYMKVYSKIGLNSETNYIVVDKNT